MKTAVGALPEMCNVEGWKDITNVPFDVWCSLPKGHGGDHYDSFVGVSWGRKYD